MQWKKRYSVQLEDEDELEVDRICLDEDRSASYVIRFLVHEALKNRKAGKEIIMAGDSRP